MVESRNVMRFLKSLTNRATVTGSVPVQPFRSFIIVEGNRSGGAERQVPHVGYISLSSPSVTCGSSETRSYERLGWNTLFDSPRVGSLNSVQAALMLNELLGSPGRFEQFVVLHCTRGEFDVV